MKTKEVKITIPANMELVKVEGGFELKPIRIKHLNDLDIINGYYLDDDYNIVPYNTENKDDFDLVFVAKSHARKAFAIASLSQIIKSLNGDWLADWSNINQPKYTITRRGSELIQNKTERFYTLLAFKDKETRDYFLSVDEFVELANDYFEIQNHL